MNTGATVAAFERAFAEYVGARYAIALCNGTATLHTALVALGVQPGDRVAVPPLTMAATTMAVLHAGAVPVFCDVDPATWLLDGNIAWPDTKATIAVSLYGLHHPTATFSPPLIDDAAQTFRPHSGCAFTSYSFQASKILALGEGGMLVTDDEALAILAREFSSLGYRMRADQPRIDPAVLKSPTYERHWPFGQHVARNYRMNDDTAARGLDALLPGRRGDRAVDRRLAMRRAAAALYRDAIAGCAWLTPQHVPDGWTHDHWTYAVAIDTRHRIGTPWWGDAPDYAFTRIADTIVRHGGERPYAAWRLTYQEPAFRHLGPDSALARFSPRSLPGASYGCPVAEALQPRLLQCQTNTLASAERNAEALRRTLREIGG